ncbi:hypothetical protein U1Q18_021969, partial [Sarracenia purpurea var. burkii]
MVDAQSCKGSALDALFLFGDTTAKVVGAGVAIWCCCVVLLPFGAAIWCCCLELYYAVLVQAGVVH